MFVITLAERNGDSQQLEFNKNEITIGRLNGNDIVLAKGNVSKYHSRIVLKDGKFIIVDMKSTNGTYVNGKKIAAPQVIRPADKIYIGDYIINVDAKAGGEVSEDGASESQEVPEAEAEEAQSQEAEADAQGEEQGYDEGQEEPPPEEE